MRKEGVERKRKGRVAWTPIVLMERAGIGTSERRSRIFATNTCPKITIVNLYPCPDHNPNYKPKS